MISEKEAYSIERSVEQFVKGRYPTVYFIRHVFYYLRENRQLCEHTEYLRLYEEMLEYQIRQAVEQSGWDPHKEEKNREWIEFLADLIIKHSVTNYESFSKETVDEYLKHRRKAWKNSANR